MTPQPDPWVFWALVIWLPLLPLIAFSPTVVSFLICSQQSLFKNKKRTVILAYFKFSKGLHEIVYHWQIYTKPFSKNSKSQIILTVNRLSQNSHKKCKNSCTKCLAFRKIHSFQNVYKKGNLDDYTFKMFTLLKIIIFFLYLFPGFSFRDSHIIHKKIR